MFSPESSLGATRVSSCIYRRAFSSTHPRRYRDRPDAVFVREMEVDRAGEHRWPFRRHRGRARQGRARRDLRRHSERRSVQELEQRYFVVARVRRRRRDDVDRRGGRRAVGAADGLGRNGRSQHTPELELGRRGVQEHRRRKNVVEHGPGRHSLRRAHRDRSNQRGRRLRRGAGTSLGAERRARRVQDDRRRPHLEESPLRRREHWRQRSRDRSDQPASALCGHVPATAHGVGIQRRRSGLRHLQDDGWRRDVDEAHERAAVGRQGTHRAHALCDRSESRLRDGRSARAERAASIRTLDAGATWEKTSSLNTRPNYFSQIRIDPRDRELGLHARLQPRFLLLA